MQSVHRAAAVLLAKQDLDGSWNAPDKTPILCCDGSGELGYHLVHYTLELSARNTP